MLVGANAQTLTEQQRLYYTCKVWGFVKYYHSNVSTCHVNWDSVLLHVLPGIESAASNDIFYDELDTMLAAAGPMAIATYPLPDTLPLELKRNRDWTWIDGSGFRSDIQIQLDTIRNNFRPHAECVVKLNDYTTSYIGYLEFPGDNPTVNINTSTIFPSDSQRLLVFFDLWNIVKYFNPYNYICDTSWDSVLYNKSMEILSATSSNEFKLILAKSLHFLNDEHVFYTSIDLFMNLPGAFSPYIVSSYIDSQYIVTKTGVSGVNVGDIIISSDGMTPTMWEDSLQAYYCYGNNTIFHYDIANNMLNKSTYLLNHDRIILKDSLGIYDTLSVPIEPYDPSFFGTAHYPCDSLDSITWTIFPCDIGYINMALLQSNQVDSVYTNLKDKPAIIFDLRNYPNGTGYELSSLLFSNSIGFASFLLPDVTYPGTYSWYLDSVTGNTINPYNGRVIILVDGNTESQAEFTAMMLRALPHSIVVGSQTAGADGNVTYWNLTQDIQIGFTSLGVYYPNGDSTQRIGIVPDTVVKPTIEGIRQHRDEVLEAALAIGCRTAVPQVQKPAPSVSVYPNPTHEFIQVTITQSQGLASAQITDMAGRYLTGAQMTPSGANNIATINMAQFPTGIYLLTVFDNVNKITRKITKD